MIIVDEEPKPAVAAPPPPSGSPPPYTYSTAAPRIRPSNFFSVTRSGAASLSAAYVLDPLLHIPDALLPSRTGIGERPNLHIETETGSLNAEIWIVPHASAAMRGASDSPPPAIPGPAKARIEVFSRYGPVSLRVNMPAMPVSLHLTIRASSVTLALPQSYRGTLSASGLIKVSSGMDASLVVFEEVDELQRGWIGEFAMGGQQEGHSHASELHVETSGGTVSLGFVDIDEVSPEMPPPGSPSTESSATLTSVTTSSLLHSTTELLSPITMSQSCLSEDYGPLDILSDASVPSYPPSPVSVVASYPPAAIVSAPSLPPPSLLPPPPPPPPPPVTLSPARPEFPSLVTSPYSISLPHPAPDLAFSPTSGPGTPDAGLDNIPRGLVNWLVRSLEQRFGIQSQVSIQMGHIKWETTSSQAHVLCEHAKGDDGQAEMYCCRGAAWCEEVD